MSKVYWGSSSAPLVEYGVDRGMVYPIDGVGVPWRGLISVDETHDSVNEVIRFYDGEKYRSQISSGEYSATVEAYTYPTLLDNYEDQYNGLTANSRKGNKYFNFSYRTLTDKGFKIHLVYNAMAKPSNKSYLTTDDSPEAVKFSWDISTIPILVPGAKETSHFEIDSTVAYPWVIANLENLLYGSETNDPRFPTLDEVIQMFEEGSILRIIDHGDGTLTAIGRNDIVKSVGVDLYDIGEWPSVVQLDSETYRLSSL